MPTFHSTYVYGNVIIRGKTPTGTMIHYGGDSGVLDDYRKGTLFFYDNTVIVKNDGYPPTAARRSSSSRPTTSTSTPATMSTSAPPRPTTRG